MKETKKMQIMPQDEERILNDYACFGWELVSSQEVKVKDSHLESGIFTGSVYSVTESENYVNLILARDTAIANYKELNVCQKKYESAQSQLRPNVKFRFLMCLIFHVFYLAYYFLKKSSITNNNNAAFEEMENALTKARTLQGAY